MKNTFIDLSSTIINSLSQNETVSYLLIKSIKILDIFSISKIDYILFFTSIFFTFFLIYYIIKQFNKKSYIYAFFLLLPFSFSSLASTIVAWTINEDLNNKIIETNILSKPNKIENLQFSTYLHVGNDIYIFSNKCNVNIKEDINTYKTSRKNQYIGKAFDPNCNFSIMNKNNGEI